MEYIRTLNNFLLETKLLGGLFHVVWLWFVSFLGYQVMTTQSVSLDCSSWNLRMKSWFSLYRQFRKIPRFTANPHQLHTIPVVIGVLLNTWYPKWLQWTRDPVLLGKRSIFILGAIQNGRIPKDHWLKASVMCSSSSIFTKGFRYLL